MVEIGDRIFAAVAEAGLVDYARMRLSPDTSHAHTIVSSLESEVHAAAPLATPWRVIMLAKTPGELLLRAPYLTQGYLKDHVHSKKLWEGGWLHTNDIACIDENGSFRITDRNKDVIKVSGEWLSSVEIGSVANTGIPSSWLVDEGLPKG